MHFFLRGMLHRTASGEKIGFMSKTGLGSNMMFVGTTGALIALVWFSQRAHFEFDAITTTSEVMEVNRDTTSDGKAVYELTLRWIDQDGNTHVTIPRVKASSYDVPVGTELDIKFDPNDSSDVRIETAEGPWSIPLIMLLGSFMSFLLGRFLRGRPAVQ